MQKIVSLGAVLVGLMLIVVHKNLWLYTMVRPTTLLEYTLVRRVLPIVWVIMAMAIAFATGKCVQVCVNRRTRRAAAASCTDAVTFDDDNGSSDQYTTFEQKAAGQQNKCGWQRPLNSVESGNEKCSHVAKAGRPNFKALVLTAAAKLSNGQHLVVAACGPLGMVRAARRAFMSAKKEIRGGVHLDFSGAESTW